MDEARNEWVRLYLRGGMTDDVSTQSTHKGMGLVKKEVSVRENNSHHGDVSVVRSRFEADSGAVKVCEFHV